MNNPAKPVETIENLMHEAAAIQKAIDQHDATIAASQQSRSEKMKQFRAIKNKIVTLQIKGAK